jgi:hypothetical protein
MRTEGFLQCSHAASLEHGNMSIDALIADYVAAKARQEQLRDAPNQAFILSEYYAASDATSRAVFRMINHPDWTYELQEEYYPRFFEIPYPVSC